MAFISHSIIIAVAAWRAFSQNSDGKPDESIVRYKPKTGLPKGNDRTRNFSRYRPLYEWFYAPHILSILLILSSSTIDNKNANISDFVSFDLDKFLEERLLKDVNLDLKIVASWAEYSSLFSHSPIPSSPHTYP